MKRYGESGKWICTICGCTFKADVIKEMDKHNHIRWTPPKAFHRDLELYQEPKCPNCNQEMEFQA